MINILVFQGQNWSIIVKILVIWGIFVNFWVFKVTISGLEINISKFWFLNVKIGQNFGFQGQNWSILVKILVCWGNFCQIYGVKVKINQNFGC